jgi:hypothetical protein
MPFLFVLLTSIVAICSFPFFSWARTNDTSLRLGGWTGGAHFDKNSKQFDHCVARYSNDSNVTIIYSLDSEYRWHLEFSGKTWNFLRGATLNVVLRLDGKNAGLRQAVVISPHVLRVHLPDRLALFDKLQDAWGIELIAGGLKIDFKPTNNAQVLRALTRCVAKHRRFTRSATILSPIRVSNKAQAIKPAPESSKLAAEIIARTTTPNSGAVALSHFPAGVSADVVWKVGGFWFTVSTLLDETWKPRELAARIIGHDAGVCHGEIFGGAEFNSSKMVRILTTCTTSNGSLTVYYASYPRSRGGIYVFATILISAEFNKAIERSVEDFDRRLRARAAALLSR